jgi:hypothetical protein
MLASGATSRPSDDDAITIKLCFKPSDRPFESFDQLERYRT